MQYENGIPSTEDINTDATLTTAAFGVSETKMYRLSVHNTFEEADKEIKKALKR